MQRLTEIAPVLPEKLARRALTLADGVFEPYPAVLALAERLPEADRTAILARARADALAKPPSSRGRALSFLIGHVTDEECHDVVITALAFLHEDDGLLMADTLRRLAPFVDRVDPQELYPYWRQLIHDGAGKGRGDFVEWLAPLTGAMELLGGETAVRETALTLLEIGDWFP